MPSRRRFLRRLLPAATSLVATPTLLLTGCASWPDAGSAQSRALLAQPPAGLPRRVRLDATPFFPQTELQCGPATLATLLNAAGRAVAPATLSPQLFVPERGGSLQLEMLAAARRHDAIATRLPPRLSAAFHELAAGHPVGVMQNLSLPMAPLWHFAVLIGFDLDRAEVTLRSGTTRELTMDLLTFERTWARAERWAFVALPPEALPDQAEVAAVREGRLGFERVAPIERAVLAWQSAARRWPDDVVLGMGLGNALVKAGRLAEAAQAFEHTAQASDAAVAWNNLAGVQLQRRQLPQAREAARRAVQRAALAEPAWLATAQATQAEVDAEADAACATITPIEKSEGTTCQ